MDAALNFMKKERHCHMTPDDLAWELVMGEPMQDFTGIMENFVTDSDGTYGANRYEQIADCFQILITIYLEMVFVLLKCEFLDTLTDDNNEFIVDDPERQIEKYKPNFSKCNIEHITLLFRDRFAKIRYFLSIVDITDFCDSYQNDFGEYSEYYCKVLLLDDRRSSTKKYFNDAKHIPEGKRYTFALRQDDKQDQEKLEDFYAVCYLPPYQGERYGRKIKISFSKLNVMTKDPHIENN